MNNTTTKQLRQAQRLIKSGRYVQARRLLVTIDHPRARHWLEKLDKIAPLKALGSRGIIGWLRDHILIAGLLGLIVLVIGFLSGQALLNNVTIGKRCNAETVANWWQEQELLVYDFLSDTESIAMARLGEFLADYSVQMRQTRDTFADAPVPECADASVFGGYQQVLDNMDVVFAAIDDFQSGALLPVPYGDLLRTARNGINAGRMAIDAAID